MQMMVVVNLFSSSFTAASIFVGMEFGYVFHFLLACPEISLHVFLMAVCSAVGQARHAHPRATPPTRPDTATSSTRKTSLAVAVRGSPPPTLHGSPPQLFIFYTIKAFGPLVFATIQTVATPPTCSHARRTLTPHPNPSPAGRRCASSCQSSSR